MGHLTRIASREPIRALGALAVGIAIALGGSVASARDAALPRQNLRIEWRWVRPTAPAAAPPGAAAYVVGTQRSDRLALTVQQVIVANGETASVALIESLPQTSVDYAVGMYAPGPRPTPSPRPPIATPVARPDAGQAAAGPDHRRGGAIEVYAAPRDGWIARTRGFEVGVRWAGGTRPVRVRIRATLPNAQDAPEAQGELDTTVDAVLGAWETVAIGAREPSAPPGAVVVGTRAIDSTRAPDLQLRVTLAR